MTHPDNTDVERVARAIHQCHFHPKDHDSKEWEEIYWREQKLYREMAKAAIAAIPTPNVAVADSLLRRLKPHLDAIVCYASTMDEHEPNRLAVDVREYLKANVATQGKCYDCGGDPDNLCLACRSEPSGCPKCHGPADNGYDRCYPPNPYYCTKCAHLPAEAAKDVRELVEAARKVEITAGAAVAFYDYDDHTEYSDCVRRLLDEDVPALAKALSHFDAKPEASAGWRPIETAPKDGTWIIGSELNEYGKWARYITYYTASMPWSEQWLFDHDEESEYCPAGWFKETSDDEIVNSCKPTHWMPLPAAPKLSTEAGDGK